MSLVNEASPTKCPTLSARVYRDLGSFLPIPLRAEQLQCEKRLSRCSILFTKVSVYTLN